MSVLSRALCAIAYGLFVGLSFTACGGGDSGGSGAPAGVAPTAQLVQDINTGLAGSRLNGLTDVNGTLFFRADDGTTGVELWKSDGTAAGTVLVKDIIPGLNSSAPVLLTNVNQIYLKVTQAWRDMKKLRGGCLQECSWIEADHSRGDTARRPAE